MDDINVDDGSEDFVDSPPDENDCEDLSDVEVVEK